MKTENWSGLITNASPYALPPGAAVEQLNFHNAIPGQLTSRGGMRKVAHVGDRLALSDVCSVQIDGKVFLLALGEDGLHALESPVAGEETGAPLVPSPSNDGGVVRTTYLWQYQGYGAAVVDPPGGEPEESDLVIFLDGGRSDTDAYDFYINANEQCAGDQKISLIEGGRSGTAAFPPVIRESELCYQL